jgi:hypothetical protein
MAGEGFALKNRHAALSGSATPAWLSAALSCGWGRYQVTPFSTSPCSETRSPADRSRDFLI